MNDGARWLAQGNARIRAAIAALPGPVPAKAAHRRRYQRRQRRQRQT